ncbi:uncharacterized protein [Temnothorax nylanderi]|uniref:uncharacterized protein n=1 Tax=Temnothorax nylanderi TaxID=102681 RepID=UPI003A8ABA57
MTLQAWVDRACGGFIFRLMQMLTGHGYFGDYLCRIRRKRMTRYHYCGDDRDMAQHTLEVCPAWVQERRVLVNQVNENLSLPRIIVAMLEREDSWRTVLSFCETVMSQKEAAKMECRGEKRHLF